MSPPFSRYGATRFFLRCEAIHHFPPLRRGGTGGGRGSRRATYSKTPLVLLSLVLSLGMGPGAQAQPPARGTRDLLKLIPPDAGLVLTVDDLRGHTRDLLSSRLAGEFQKLPAMKAWFDSEKYQGLEDARDHIEAVLQVSLLDIRDKILGDAVVFALRLPAEAPIDPGQAQGVLALKAADPALLKRLIDLVNTTQKQNGDIATIDERKHGDHSYFVREYPAGSERPAEAYVIFADGTFALSNSETLIKGVMERKAARPGASGPSTPASLAEVARFRALERQLPEQALARLFIDARLVERLFKSATQQKPRGEERHIALVERWLDALQYAGATLTARDGRLPLHIAETFDPHKLDELLGRAAMGADSAVVASKLDHVPATTLAVGSIQIDFALLYKTVLQLVPEPDQPRLANFETALSGIFLGEDLRTRILPALGPRVTAYLDAPADFDSGTSPNPGNWPFPTTLAVELGDDPDQKPRSPSDRPAAPARATVAAATDNALRTLLAVLALDEKRAQGRSRIIKREVSGITISTLDPPIPFAYALDRSGHRLILGTSAAAVERHILAGSDNTQAARFRQLQAAVFADAQSFLCLDLAAAETLMRKHRDQFTKMIAARDKRSVEDVSGDLDQFLALAHLFDAAFLTLRVDRTSATVHETLGVLARPGEVRGVGEIKH